MKPILKYSGGKSKELPKLLPYIPEYSGYYIEPFFGGGAMFFHLEPKRAIISDVNFRLMNFYERVACDYDKIKGVLERLSSLYAKNRAAFDEARKSHVDEKAYDANAELYYFMRDLYNGKIHSDDVYSSAVYYFINKTAYSGMTRFNSKGEYNVPFGRYKSFKADSLTRKHSDLLSRSNIVRGVDYAEIFNLASPDDFMFLDPPYDCTFSDYGNDGDFNEESHKRLAADFRNLGCKTLMVIGATDLTRELYKDFVVDEYNKNYSVNIKNRFKSAAVHMIVTNYKIEK